MSREATNRLLEMVEEGALDRDAVIMACVKYMSEDDVADMCHANEFFTCAECGASIDAGQDMCEDCEPEEEEESEATA